MPPEQDRGGAVPLLGLEPPHAENIEELDPKPEADSFESSLSPLLGTIFLFVDDYPKLDWAEKSALYSLSASIVVHRFTPRIWGLPGGSCPQTGPQNDQF
jgi:hypothetical protein